MTTLVGTQTEFSDALTELVELEYDACEAYQAAIERIENIVYKEKLEEFIKDHQRHIQELSQLLAEHGRVAPQGPDIKQHVLKGKVIAANVISDDAVLKAMQDNEIDVHTAYQRLNNHPAQWLDAEDILIRSFADEKKHKAWLEMTTSRNAL